MTAHTNQQYSLLHIHFYKIAEATDDSLDDSTPIECSKPTIDNGSITPLSDSVAVGENYTVTCNGSYSMFGNDIMECRDDGSLSMAAACISEWFNTRWSSKVNRILNEKTSRNCYDWIIYC